MTNQYVWLGITVAVSSIVLGIGVSYAILVTMPDHDTMESQNQHMSTEMMSQNPLEEHEMMLEMTEHIMEDEHLREHMMAHMMENQKLVHQMFTFMEQSPELMLHMEAHVTGNMTGFEMLED